MSPDCLSQAAYLHFPQNLLFLFILLGKASGYGRGWEIFHPTKDMPEASPSFWGLRGLLIHSVTVLCLEREVMSAIVLTAEVWWV